MNKIIFCFFVILIVCVFYSNGQYGYGNNEVGFNNLPIQLPTSNGGNFEQDIDIKTNGRRTHYHRSCRNGLCYISKAPSLNVNGLIFLIAAILATKLL
jgi:hypothetical protein